LGTYFQELLFPDELTIKEFNHPKLFRIVEDPATSARRHICKKPETTIHPALDGAVPDSTFVYYCLL
jgi:hypothetical protein